MDDEMKTTLRAIAETDVGLLAAAILDLDKRLALLEKRMDDRNTKYSGRFR